MVVILSVKGSCVRGKSGFFEAPLLVPQYDGILPKLGRLRVALMPLDCRRLFDSFLGLVNE